MSSREPWPTAPRLGACNANGSAWTTRFPWFIIASVAIGGLATSLSEGEAPLLMNPIEDESSAPCGTQWGTPKRLDPNAQSEIARFPRIAVGHEKTYVVGVEFQLADRQPMPVNPLHVWGTDGTSVGRPNGHFKYLFPRGGVDASGRLHLIWGEPAPDTGTVAVREWYFLASQTLWTATFDPTAGWTAAKKIAFTPSGVDGLKWDWRGTADNFGSGPFQGLGLEERRRRRGAPLEYLALDEAGNWRRSQIDVPRDAGAIAVVAEAQRIIAFYDSAIPDPAILETKPVSAILMRISRDRGVTWERPRTLVPVSNGRVRDLHAIASRDGRMDIVWREETANSSVIRHAFSPDSATTWSVSADLLLPGKFQNMRSVVDRCRVVHLVGEDWQGGSDQIHLSYARFDGHWSEVAHLFKDLTAMTPDLRLMSDGQPLMVFVARTSAVPGSRFSTYYSALQR